MANMQLPPCGLYRTTAQIGPIPPGRLVFFHNHGDPGPGLYLPESWKANRMKPRQKGTVLPGPEYLKFLEPLPPEGFYRVTEPFFCCEKRCRRFEADSLVQLGYNAGAEPLLFLPEMVDGLLAIPERGTRIDDRYLERLKRLKVRSSERKDAPVQ
jgi:hypothetical protein